MNLQSTLVLLIAVLVSGAGLAALLVLCAALWPGLVAETRQAVERRPVRAFFVGLVNACFFLLIVAALGSRGDLGGLAGLLVFTALLGFVALGLAAVAQLLGERLCPDEPRPLRRLLAGAAALELAALTPVVGWLAVGLLACLTGYGALVIVLAARLRPRPTHPGDADTKSG